MYRKRWVATFLSRNTFRCWSRMPKTISETTIGASVSRVQSASSKNSCPVCVTRSAELATCNQEVDARQTRQIDEYAVKAMSALLGIGDHLSEGGEIRKANSARSLLPEN